MGKIITNNLLREFNRDKKKREAISKISRSGRNNASRFNEEIEGKIK